VGAVAARSIIVREFSNDGDAFILSQFLDP